MTVSSRRVLFAALVSMMSFTAFNAYAGYYDCAKKIYEGGWFRKYEYKGETWGANTKKSNAISSTTHVATENTTSSLDPGVFTGHFVSMSQYTSSWGACAAVDIEISQMFRQEYIEQNLHEIKKQIASGEGYHLDSLAVLSGCQGYVSPEWNQTLQSHIEMLYDANDGKSFSQVLDQVIEQNPTLATLCHPTTA